MQEETTGPPAGGLGHRLLGICGAEEEVSPRAVLLTPDLNVSVRSPPPQGGAPGGGPPPKCVPGPAEARCVQLGETPLSPRCSSAADRVPSTIAQCSCERNRGGRGGGGAKRPGAENSPVLYQEEEEGSEMAKERD